eukprot:671217_1
MTKRRRSPKLDSFPSQVINLDSFGGSESHWADIQPFPHRRIDNFVNTDFLEIVKSEILRGLKGSDSINFRKKSNDLYEFHQSDELVSCKNEWISKLRDSLYSSEVRERLSQITGIKLSDKPDMFAAIYQKTHRLLCHDDQLESRSCLHCVPCSTWLGGKRWRCSRSLFGHARRSPGRRCRVASSEVEFVCIFRSFTKIVPSSRRSFSGQKQSFYRRLVPRRSNCGQTLSNCSVFVGFHRAGICRCSGRMDKSKIFGRRHSGADSR